MGQLDLALVERYKERGVVTSTVFLTPEQKARIAVLQPLALSILGNKRYTESALLRALVDILDELGIDWERELRAAEVGGRKPREVLRTIIEKKLCERYQAERPVPDGQACPNPNN